MKNEKQAIEKVQKLIPEMLKKICKSGKKVSQETFDVLIQVIDYKYVNGEYLPSDYDKLKDIYHRLTAKRK